MNRLLIFLFGLLFLLTSCFEVEDVEVVKMGKISVEEIEGSNAKIRMEVEVDNPNFFSIKVKPASLDVYVEDMYVGKANLLDNVKLKRKKVANYVADIQLIGEPGVLLKLMRFALKKEVKVRATGTVRGSVYGITRRVQVDETKTINGGLLKMGLPF